jgi:hypothetical protein
VKFNIQVFSKIVVLLKGVPIGVTRVSNQVKLLEFLAYILCLLHIYPLNDKSQCYL